LISNILEASAPVQCRQCLWPLVVLTAAVNVFSWRQVWRIWRPVFR